MLTESLLSPPVSSSVSDCHQPSATADEPTSECSCTSTFQSSPRGCAPEQVWPVTAPCHPEPWGRPTEFRTCSRINAKQPVDRGNVHGYPRTSADPASSAGQANLHTHKPSITLLSLCRPSETELAGDKTAASSGDPIKRPSDVSRSSFWLSPALLPSPVECFSCGREAAYSPERLEGLLPVAGVSRCRCCPTAL